MILTSFDIKNIYQAQGLIIISSPKVGPEGAEYSAYHFGVNGKSVAFRVRKMTSIRFGNFVTLWKKPGKNIEPIDVSDDLDFVAVFVSNRGDSG